MIKQLSTLGIPLAMATQHPDVASKCITAEQEIDETIHDITPFEGGGFNCDEKMIDYEGKLTPYHQVKWTVEKLQRLGYVAGKDYIITPRVPNPRLENIDRHLIVILSAIMANTVDVEAVQYIINPMTTSSSEVIAFQRRVWRIAKLLEDELNVKFKREIQLIPLIEGADVMFRMRELARDWINSLIKTSMLNDKLRIMIGKSDTAMVYGHATSIISIKYALSSLWKIAEEFKVSIYPIIGVGKLPFRGNLSPDAVEEFADTYRWFYTVTIQSGIRFDMGVNAVSKVLTVIKDKVGRKPRTYDEDEERQLINACKVLTREYVSTILKFSSKILIINSFIPRRRDRVEVSSYSRSLLEGALFSEDKDLINVLEDRNIILPRAINFVAALYTMGIPPTVIGLGRGLTSVEKSLGHDVAELIVKEISPIIIKDLEFDLALLDLNLASKYFSERKLKLIHEDLEEIEKWFKVEPISDEWVDRHRSLTRQFQKYMGREDAVKFLVEAGILRGSLG